MISLYDKNTQKDQTLETLLALDGEVFLLENGYWVKFFAKRLEPGPHVPFGIRYSLTLHDRNNIRILGFDNAHAVRRKGKKHGSRMVTWDHKHSTRRVAPYRFQSASKLIEDFWKAVNNIVD
jgi:hypothetical protein